MVLVPGTGSLARSSAAACSASSAGSSGPQYATTGSPGPAASISTVTPAAVRATTAPSLSRCMALLSVEMWPGALNR